MKKTLAILAAAVLLPAMASADTTLDLLSTLSTSTAITEISTSIFSSSITSTVTASNVTTWLSGQSDGVYGTALNGATNFSPTNLSFTSSGDSSYTLAYTIRGGYGAGSVLGIVSTIDADLSSVTSLSLSYTNVNAAISSSLTLVYQVDGEWVSRQVSFSSTSGGTVTVELEGDTLSASTVYAVLATSKDSWTQTTGTISLTATSSAVPEPATATLGLLALGALALRRRRA
ncbi:MAG: PEP-CTERM sorting domain-containing protein [Akkermansiaceae bacterium]|nr:PEP-CTERM sorting domain-containing protein [Akkermansiaceae bacterium]